MIERVNGVPDSAGPGRRRKGRLALLIVTVLMGVAGAALLGATALNTAQYDWMPLQIPLAREVGEPANGAFRAEVSAIYEVTLEYNAVLTKAELRDLMIREGDQAAADVSWSVSEADRVISAGGSRVHLYRSTGGRTLLGRMKRRLLGIPFHQDAGSFVQVVGRFPGEAGQRYEVTVVKRALAPQLEATGPRLRLRLSREFWIRHTEGMLAFSYAGIALIVVSIVCLLIWTFTGLTFRWGRG